MVTGMVLSLCKVFGGRIGESMAKTLVIQALKKQIMKQPLKFATKELSKLIPFAGSIVGDGLSIALIEVAGWEFAREFDRKYSNQNYA